MSYVLGKNVVMYVYRDSVPVLTVCATNLSRKQTAGSVSRLVRGAGSNRIYSSTIKDETLTLDGLTTLDDVGRWQYDEFNPGDALHILISYTNSYGDVLSYDGNILVTGIDDNNQAGDFSSYSISMVRSGAWTKLKTYNGALLDSFGDPIWDSNGELIRTS